MAHSAASKANIVRRFLMIVSLVFYFKIHSFTGFCLPAFLTLPFCLFCFSGFCGFVRLFFFPDDCYIVDLFLSLFNLLFLWYNLPSIVFLFSVSHFSLSIFFSSGFRSFCLSAILSTFPSVLLFFGLLCLLVFPFFCISLFYFLLFLLYRVL